MQYLDKAVVSHRVKYVLFTQLHMSDEPNFTVICLYHSVDFKVCGSIHEDVLKVSSGKDLLTKDLNTVDVFHALASMARRGIGFLKLHLNATVDVSS